ncbi:MAG: hypothetical protein FWB86_08965 [Treponema sp.]|nr:hypothetical protein [Treponema sp.]MCL2251581.1 hypothetical protein [Treponema sp.]
MGIVQYVIDTDNPPQFTEKELAELEALKDRPIDYSDSRKMTAEEIRKGRLLAIEIRKKQKKMFSLRLRKTTIDWWKSLGDGYTGVMAHFLDEAVNHPEWVQESLKTI